MNAVETGARAPEASLPAAVAATAWAVAAARTRRLVSRSDAFPTYTDGERWVLSEDAWAPVWTGGFLTGLLWALYEETDDAAWKELALSCCERLAPRRRDAGTHDLGFIFTYSWGRRLRHDPGPRTVDTLVTAARTLASSFNEQGGYIRTWVAPGSTFIDVMMNLELLYLGAELSGDHRLADVANAHARTSRRYLVRGDGSTAHEGLFEPETGHFQHWATHQGLAADSSWARGLAWAILGFTIAYEYSGDEDFLTTAWSCSDYFRRHSGPALVPPNDFCDPDPRPEASAAAIAAAGFTRLGQVAPDGPRAQEAWAHGVAILGTLAGAPFLQPASAREGIVGHATYHTRNGLGVDTSNMWGDYFFVEALENATAGRHLRRSSLRDLAGHIGREGTS